MSRSPSADAQAFVDQFKSSLQPVCDIWSQIRTTYSSHQTEYYNIYNRVPGQISSFKRDYILRHGNENTRLIGLGLATLGSSLILRKVSSGPFSLLRNVYLSYFGIGLFVVPEIYNPSLVQ